MSTSVALRRVTQIGNKRDSQPSTMTSSPLYEGATFKDTITGRESTNTLCGSSLGRQKSSQGQRTTNLLETINVQGSSGTWNDQMVIPISPQPSKWMQLKSLLAE